MRFTVDRLDHLVLTCADIERTASWYQRVLGMEREAFGEQKRTALKFGGQKLNLHQSGREFKPHAAAAAPGTQDLCFITAVPSQDVVRHLRECGLTVEEGPVPKTGALGPMTSVYCRDPDGNLIEIASYLAG
ncbi:VOC family protein [Limobrevibacterium gyesilva]|uniref:VOC family protein n=1 Tax=Limobrevibacterium gyesilva TaxID=2991712 RepID=A0AA41YNN7_9PROT|nr:VOC family protein [Limobrevibacterium gyesilva]MCW3475871.1 VOC family protein [Limobrevibacterium gyesilva]